MNKNTLAMEILGELKREKMFWKAAFIVVFASLVTVIIDHATRKAR